jgi:transposase
MAELAEIVESGPDPVTEGVIRWRRIELKRAIEERFGVVYSERAISDLLRTLSFSSISARPQHPRQDQRVLEGFTYQTLQVFSTCRVSSHKWHPEPNRPGICLAYR